MSESTREEPTRRPPHLPPAEIIIVGEGHADVVVKCGDTTTDPEPKVTIRGIGNGAIDTTFMFPSRNYTCTRGVLFSGGEVLIYEFDDGTTYKLVMPAGRPAQHWLNKPCQYDVITGEITLRPAPSKARE